MLLHFAQSSKAQISSWDVRHIGEIIPKTQVHKNSDSYLSLYCIYFATAPNYKCPLFRYSHSAHMIGGNLVVVGGVWLHSGGVPDVVVINLITRCCTEFRLDRVSQSSPAVLCAGLEGKGSKSTCVLASSGRRTLASDAALVLFWDPRPRRTRASPAWWRRELFLFRDPL